MTIEQDNVDTLRKAYSRWAESKGSDFSCWTDLTADHATLDSLADGAAEVAFTRSRVGKAEVLEYLRGLTAEWEMISYDVDEFIAQGDRVVALGRTAWRNRKTGKIADTPKLDVWRMQGGEAVEFQEFYDTAQMIAAATP
jgi:ketosteroid isomerase-like protein